MNVGVPLKGISPRGQVLRERGAGVTEARTSIVGKR